MELLDNMAVPLYKYVLATTCLLYPRTDIFHGERRIPESQHAAVPIASQSKLAQRYYHVMRSWYLVHTVTPTDTFSINTVMLLRDSSVCETDDRVTVVLFPGGARVFLFPNYPDCLAAQRLPRALCQQERGLQWRTEGGWEGAVQLPPPRNSEGPPNSCQTQPYCENCYKLLNLGRQHPKMFGGKKRQ